MSNLSIDISTLFFALLGALALVEAAVLFVLVADLRLVKHVHASAVTPMVVWVLGNVVLGGVLGVLLRIGWTACLLGVGAGAIFGGVHSSFILLGRTKDERAPRRAPASRGSRFVEPRAEERPSLA
jgi:hypothetical protein